MNRQASLRVAVVSLGLLLGAIQAFAQTVAPPIDQPKAGEGQLTYETLKTMLENMGYEELKEFKDKEGNITGYQVKKESGTWSFYGVFMLSPDKSNIWISVCLGKIADPGTAPGKVLLDMLAANNKVWPNFFYYVESNNCLYLDGFLPNRAVKAKDMRARFDSLCEQVQRYESLWNQKKWPEVKK